MKLEVLVPFFQIRKGGVPEVRELAQVYVATTAQSKDPNPSLSIPDLKLSPLRQVCLINSGQRLLGLCLLPVGEILQGVGSDEPTHSLPSPKPTSCHHSLRPHSLSAHQKPSPIRGTRHRTTDGRKRQTWLHSTLARTWASSEAQLSLT